MMFGFGPLSDFHADVGFALEQKVNTLNECTRVRDRMHSS